MKYAERNDHLIKNAFYVTLLLPVIGLFHWQGQFVPLFLKEKEVVEVDLPVSA